ncbi:MAG TPA: zinc ribbon domain-containing protein [Abditibacteriaceae bacterium]
MRCPKCGTNNPPEEQLTYCKKCGTELRTVCPRCSADNPGNAEHCSDCGLDLHPDRGHERAAGIRKDKDTVIVAGVLKKKPTFSAGMLAAAVVALIIVWIPIFMVLKKRSQLQGCQGNLKKLALAMQAYARDNGGHAPTASDWTAALLPYVQDRNTLICPARPGKFGYSFNLGLNEAPLAQITNSGTVIAFFESDAEENSSGTQNLWLASSVHARGNNLAFADGTVRQSLTPPADQYWSVKSKTPQMPAPTPADASSSSPQGAPTSAIPDSGLSSGSPSAPVIPTVMPPTVPDGAGSSATPINPPPP